MTHNVNFSFWTHTRAKSRKPEVKLETYSLCQCNHALACVGRQKLSSILQNQFSLIIREIVHRGYNKERIQGIIK